MQVTAVALVEGLRGAQQGVIEGAQGGTRTVGGRQRPGVRVLPYGGGESPGRFGRPPGDGLPGPREGRRGLAERQRGGVLRVQPPLGGGGGVTPQPGPGEGVLRMVEGGGERDATGGGVVGPGGIEEVGDGVVHGGYGVPLAVEPEVAGDGAGGRKGEAQREQPPCPGEEGNRPQPPGLRDRHPGAHGGGDEHLRTRGGGDGPDGTDTAGEQPDAGEEKGERDRSDMVPGVGPDEEPAGPGERGQPEPPDGHPTAAGPVVDPGEHGGDGGYDAEGGAVEKDGGEEEGAGGEGSAYDRAPGNRAALGTERVGEPGR